MVALALKSDASRPGWYLPEEVQLLTVDGVRWRVIARPHVWRPPTDVFETDEAIIVRLEIAGVREEDLRLSIDDHILTVRGFRADTSERRAYYQMEIPFGEFSTEIELPVAVETDAIQAFYRDGFLRVILPKKRPRLIPIGD